MTTNTRGNLTKKAYDLISSKIINLDFKPGEKISEKKIENNLGIGRTPVREALLQLKQEHLINVVPQSGTYVSKIDLEMVKESCFVRAGLERKIMHQAAEHDFAADQVAVLAKILEKQQEASKNNEYALFFKYNDEFHEYFYRLTNHMIVWQWLRQINMAFKRFRYLRLKVNNLSCTDILQEHQRLLQATIDNNTQLVDQITANDIQLQSQRVELVLDRFPDYFQRTR
ncbi:GntR family transcriptional regulator [Limosilactobacillus caccae]|uniref:GntR family transcriptional regulator n=1 Tax=Limosilactobacillus caccae TaxID=1926284 RepID=UPI0009702C9A|nr:GntR family transcriptional regulator [Limosilactobacillus caccae]